MAKIKITYDEIDYYVADFLSKINEGEYVGVVAINRGGLTIAHMIAKRLNVNIAIGFPKSGTNDTNIVWGNITPTELSLGKVLVVDDLVAKGRTYKEFSNHLKKENIMFDYYAFLRDANYPESKNILSSISTDKWIVFPWEEYTKVVEGDRGLFRHGTDKYGKG